jgi:hypothetical protein
VSEPTKLERAVDDFDGRPPICSDTIDGDPTYAYRPMLSFDERFPPIRKKVEPPKFDWDKDTQTYLMGIEGSRLTKIGKAKHPKSRLEQLQTGQPATLSLLWTCSGFYEGKLHRRFRGYRVRGEWFDLTPLGDPVEVVKAAVKEIEAAEAAKKRAGGDTPKV